MIKKIYKAVFVNFRIFGLCAAMCMVVAFSSCSRDDESLTEPERYSSKDITSYEDLFRGFWTVMDDNYNYFYEEKERNNLDWDQVYAEYLPKFKALKTWEREGYSNDEITKEADIARSYFEEIVNGITDRHFSLKIEFPESRTESSETSFRGGMKEDAPLFYNKTDTKRRMKDKLEVSFSKSLYLGPLGFLSTLGGYLQSAPDTFYFSFNSFYLLFYEIDLSNSDSFLFNDPADAGLIDRSELEQNTKLTTIENEELRKFIRDWTIETYDTWHEALTITLQSEVLAGEVDRFNRTEEVTDALLEEVTYLQEVIEGLSDTQNSAFDNNVPSSYDDNENAQNYVSNFRDRIKEMKKSYNLSSFEETLKTIKNNAWIYQSFFNPLHRGEIKKLILDLRGNGGGAVIDTRFFVERLVTKEALVGYQRTKEGNGRFNYTPWAPMHTKPHPFAIPDPIPIIILTDYGSVSMSEMTTMTLKTQGNMVKSVGDYTRGATAGLGRSDDFNGGTKVEIKDVMKFYMPLMATKDASGKVIEGIGVEPDVYVAPPTEEEIKDMKNNPEGHKDRTFEKAIEVISGM